MIREESKKKIITTIIIITVAFFILLVGILLARKLYLAAMDRVYSEASEKTELEYIKFLEENGDEDELREFQLMNMLQGERCNCGERIGWTRTKYNSYLALEAGKEVSIQKQLDVITVMAEDMIKYYTGNFWNVELYMVYDESITEDEAQLTYYSDEGIHVGDTDVEYFIFSKKYFEDWEMLKHQVFDMVRYEIACSNIKVHSQTEAPVYWDNWYKSEEFRAQFR